MRVLLAIAVLSFGCSKKEQAKPVEPPPRPAEPPRPPPPKAGSIDALAAALGAKVKGQGTADLDDTPGPDRWAQLEMSDGEHGAYVIEASGKAFLARYDADGRTQPWPGDPDGKAIVHQQGHRAGYERWELAVRGGELVVLREEAVDDARDDDVPKRTDYADPSGTCTKPCPKAGDHGFTVSTGATLEALGGPSSTMPR